MVTGSCVPVSFVESYVAVTVNVVPDESTVTAYDSPPVPT